MTARRKARCCYCGCTDARAYVMPSGTGCWWVNDTTQKPQCSACGKKPRIQLRVRRWVRKYL